MQLSTRRGGQRVDTALEVEQPHTDATGSIEERESGWVETLARFGHSRFRPGQREAIECLLEHRRLLLVAPTGGGKSLTYQLPALWLGGTSVVVSPLVALMHDQVEALRARGIEATYLASTLSGECFSERLRTIRRGSVRLVYVAPERLSHPGFQALLDQIDPPLIAIDEAHCISAWGHDFRPDYLRIGAFVSRYPRARVLACTATATPIVRDDILERLGLPADTPQLLRGFARPNLALAVEHVAGVREAQPVVDRTLVKALGAPGRARGAAIVYAPTRRRTEREAARLARAGWRVAAYHAGLSGEQRSATQERFAAGDIDIVVATNAFGMGIDRADVRAVVHLAPPGSLEAYYQEVGRAGRDGLKAWGVLLIAPSDIPLRRRLLRMGNENGAPPADVVEHKWGLFLELLRWADAARCRHDGILAYFGDEAETLSGCGHCDVCAGERGAPPELSDEETALLVRKALSGVARVHGRFGLRAAALLLKGRADERLRWSGLAATRTFGVLSEWPLSWIEALVRRCIGAGWVDFAGGPRPIVLLTGEGKTVMQGRKPACLQLPALRTRRTAAVAGSASAAAGRNRPCGSGNEADDEAQRRLFEALRRYRLEVASAQGVAAYRVASDRTLREIAALRPRDEAQLLLVHGIGAAKLARYGQGFLRVVASEGRESDRASPSR